MGECGVREILASAVKPEARIRVGIAAIAASRGFIVASRNAALYEAAKVTVINPWEV
jgi:predicted nucleic acid-binding protein